MEQRQIDVPAWIKLEGNRDMTLTDLYEVFNGMLHRYAIQSLLGISDGGFEDSTQVKEVSDEGDETEEGIGNVGHLVL